MAAKVRFLHLNKKIYNGQRPFGEKDKILSIPLKLKAFYKAHTPSPEPKTFTFLFPFVKFNIVIL